ncbi:hypothetical protein Nepgr_007143 [Nepenthes gracilis]|uniref:Senescence regulator n=1 Tax=Nepenthes gracilis TaxID=150966 RepID=A0AAD3S6H8_NEPGR|nr:hypothetical protein Nepgr_007143 [Nepenthes gracilis]
MASKFAVTSRANGRRNLKDEDFEEEDVWCAMENKESSGPKVRNLEENSLSFSSFSSSSSWRSPTAPATIPRASNPSKEANKMTMVKQSSAPMDIPGRRKVYGLMSSKKKSCPWVDYDGHGMNDDDGEVVVVDDDDNDEDEIVPPHEYIARRLASSQISSSSVCEGIGRTLKGRDLSKVRNTILRKTGFLEG